MKPYRRQRVLLIAAICTLGIVASWSTPARAERPHARVDPFWFSGASPQAPSAETISLTMQPSIFDCVLPGQVVNFSFSYATDTQFPTGGAFTITDPTATVIYNQPFPFVPPMPTTPPINYTSAPIAFTVPAMTGIYTARITITDTVPRDASLSFRVRFCGNLHVLKFQDTNGNGVQDPGELGIPNWQITVTPPPGAITPPEGWVKLTGPDGFANWDDIDIGTYTVTEQALPWWVPTTPTSVTVDLTTGETEIVVFGNQATGNLAVCKFMDVNGNGVQDVAEPFIPGWSMTVTPPPGYVWPFPSTQLTGPDGCAYWNNAPIGTYTVAEEDRSFEDWLLTTPPNPKTVTVTQSGTATVLFGNQLQYSITGRKTNQDGAGVANWTIHARPCGGFSPTLTTVTNADGYYIFETPALTVPPTCWTVYEDVLPGWTPLTPTSVDVTCIEGHLHPPAAPGAPGAPTGGSNLVFLPMLIGGGGASPASPAVAHTPGCGTANFQNRMPPFHPKGIAANLFNHRLYIGVQGANYVIVADVDRTDPLQPFLTQVGAAIPVGNGPFGVGVNEVTNEIYVANYRSDSVSVISGATNTVVNTISLAPYGQPTYIGVYTDTNRIYVPLHANGMLAVVDGATKTLLRTVYVGTGAFGVTIDRERCRAYVSSRDSLWISSVNICLPVEQVVPEELIRLGPPGATPHYEPYSLAIDPGLATLHVPVHPQPDPRFGFNPEQGWTYQLPILTAVPEYTLTPAIGVTSLERGGDQGGVGIAVNPATHNVFVPSYQDNSVSCLNAQTRPANALRLGTTYDGRPFASPIMNAIDPAYGYVYITNYNAPGIDLLSAVGIVLDSAPLCP